MCANDTFANFLNNIPVYNFYCKLTGKSKREEPKTIREKGGISNTFLIVIMVLIQLDQNEIQVSNYFESVVC